MTTASDAVLLGVDVGTSGVKGVAIDGAGSGEVVASATHALAMQTPKPTYSSSPVGPAKRLAEWITCGKPRLRAQMRVQVWPPVALSSVTVTIIGTPVSRPVGSGPPISLAACANHQPMSLKEISSTTPT